MHLVYLHSSVSWIWKCEILVYKLASSSFVSVFLQNNIFYFLQKKLWPCHKEVFSRIYQEIFFASISTKRIYKWLTWTPNSWIILCLIDVYLGFNIKENLTLDLTFLCNELFIWWRGVSILSFMKVWLIVNHKMFQFSRVHYLWLHCTLANCSIHFITSSSTICLRLDFLSLLIVVSFSV